MSERDVSPALRALYRGETEAAERLLPEEPNLFEAAAFGRTDRLRALLEADPGLPHTYSADGFTALHLAAFFGHPEAVRVLLEAGADRNAVATSTEIGPVQPLHSAAATDQVESVRLLVEAGADVNARQGGGLTALHAAAVSRNEVLARLLLGAGADPEAAADDGSRPDLDFLA